MDSTHPMTRLGALMGKAATGRRLVPWIAVVGGLALGLATRDGLSRTASRSDPTAGSLQDKPLSETKPLPPGPTSRAVRDVSSLDAAGCEQRIKELAADSMNKHGVTAEAIYLRWISLTSADEVVAAFVASDLRWRSELRDALFNAWVIVDPKAAMDLAARPEFDVPRAVHAIESGREDFAGFLSAAWKPNTTSNLNLERALVRLAREQPEIARQLPDSPADLQKMAICAVARGWARNDPQAALRWIQSMAPGSDSARSGMQALLVTWAEFDAEAAGKAMNSEAMTSWLGEQSAGMGLTVEALKTPDTPTSACVLALQRDPFVDAADLHRLLTEQEFDWDSRDPMRQSRSSLMAWVPPDPAKSAQEAADLPAGPARDLLLDHLCGLWAEHDPDGALDFANARGLESPAVTALREKPTKAMRDAAFADPESAFAALFDEDRELPAGVTREQAFAMAEEWGAKDPVAAAEWLAMTPGALDVMTPRPPYMLNNILGNAWTQRDPVGATDWVLSLPEGPGRQIAWNAMEEQVTSYSPDLAFAVTATLIDDESRRGSLLRSELQQVRQSIGREAALQLLESSNLSDAERESLRETLNPGGR